jgi:hypothetical protein
MRNLLCLLFGVALLCIPAAGAAHPLEYRSYEKGGVFPEVYRDDFAQTLKKYPNGRFARACRGERISIQRYFNRALEYSLDDRRNEALGYVLAKIMFRVGDERFARALRGGEPSTRQAVGRNLDPLIARHHLKFPQTRSCYRYRAGT